MNSVLQDVLKKGSGVYINPEVQSKVPVAAKTGTNNSNGATWVLGYTSGIATAPSSATHWTARNGRAGISPSTASTTTGSTVT